MKITSKVLRIQHQLKKVILIYILIIKKKTLIENVRYTNYERLKLLSFFKRTNYHVEIVHGKRHFISNI